LFSKFSVEPMKQCALRVKKRQRDLPNGIQIAAMQQSGRREQAWLQVRVLPSHAITQLAKGILPSHRSACSPPSRGSRDISRARAKLPISALPNS
jgi:hypothetical protein